MFILFWIPVMSLSLSNDTYLQCDVIFKIKYHAIFLYWRQLDGVFKKSRPDPQGTLQWASLTLNHWNPLFHRPNLVIWFICFVSYELRYKSTFILILGSSQNEDIFRNQIEIISILDLFCSIVMYLAYTLGFRKHFLSI